MAEGDSQAESSPAVIDEVDRPIVALKLKMANHQRMVGVAARVPRQRKSLEDKVRWNLFVYEFLDNDQFSSLDTLMLQLAPGECLLALDADAAKGKPRGDVAKILGVMERRDVTVHDFKAGHFKTDDVVGKIQALLGDASFAQHSLPIEQPIGTACLAALVDRFQRRGEDGENEEGEGTYSLAQGTLQKHLRLDSAAAAAVMLLPDPTAPHEFGSLFNVLNRCRTKVGSRLLERWLRQPLTDKDEIERRHDVVGFFKEEAGLRGSMRDGPLKSCPDLDSLKTKMQRRRAGLMEVFKLYLFSRSVISFVETLEAYFEGDDKTVDEAVETLIKEKFVSGFKKLTEGFSLFQQLVEHVLDMDVLPDLVINPSYSPQLEELRAEMDEIKEQVDELHQEARDGWCDFGEKDKCLLEDDKVRGFCFRLTKANLEQASNPNATATGLISRKKSVETLQVLKNGVHFTTPELRGLGRRYKELRREYEEMQSGLVEKAVETAATYIPLVESASALVSELDVLVSFGDVAAMAPIELVRPTMKGKGEGVLHMKACRHPCLEWQDDMQFIPNDYKMSSDGASFVVVTGPNMGGKSTYIRALGAVVVMAQVGSFVPCESAEMSVRDAVFARVGAGDSQQRGISTFMAEMLEASAIISAATRDSLIIIDELGRGTSTFDGFGLAWAISEHIVKEVQAPCLFATHFHEMTTMADKDKRVKNLHVTAEAKEDKMTMLYEVREGACLESFGIHVAAMAGFPRAVIREAKRKAATLENFEEAMERIGDAGLSKKRKASDDAGKVEGSAGRGGSSDKPKSTKLHRLVEMFKGLPVDEMTPREALMATRQLVDKLYVGV
ncbi:unnamed protein product [Ascophyllum nodosum]